MRVRTKHRHDNAYGDKYEKFPGKIYDHPDPQQLIDDGYLEAHDEDDSKAGRVQGT